MKKRQKNYSIYRKLRESCHKTKIWALLLTTISAFTFQVFVSDVQGATPLELPERMRGVNVPVEALHQDLFDVLAETDVNVMRVNFGVDSEDAPAPTVEDPLKPYQNNLTLLDNAVSWAEEAGVKIILCANKIYGRNLDVMWTDPEDITELQAHLVAFWVAIANRYPDNPSIIAYDVFNEPNYTTGNQSLWIGTLTAAVDAIREVNDSVWLVIEPGPWGKPTGFSSLPVLADPYVIYSFHMYAPHPYTHQDIGSFLGEFAGPYPGVIDGVSWNKEELKEYMEPAIEFAENHPTARMLVGEFSAARWALGAERYLDDNIGLFEELGWDWCFHSIGGWNGWNPTYTSDAPKTDTAADGGAYTDRLNVLVNQWGRNAPSLLASWERGFLYESWENGHVYTNTATVVDPNFSGTMSANVNEGSAYWQQAWLRSDNDATYGNLVSGALTNNGSFLMINQAEDSTNFSMEFTLTNGGGEDVELSHFCFDAYRTYDSIDTYSISIIDGSLTHVVGFNSGNFTRKDGLPPGDGGDYEDFNVSLHGLRDRILDAGTSVTFRIDFEDSGSHIGRFQMDNVAIFGRPITVLAGWERGNQFPEATTQSDDIDGTASDGVDNGTATWSTNWGAWSNDLTFGSLMDGAQGYRGAYQLNLYDTGTTGAYLEFTVTNNSFIYYQLTDFCFDAWRTYDSIDEYSVSIIGGDLPLAEDFAHGTFERKTNLPALDGDDFQDIDISLNDLADSVLGMGESVTFRIDFKHPVSLPGSRFFVDNVAVLGVPLLEVQ